MHDSSHNRPKQNEEEREGQCTNGVIVDPASEYMIEELSPKTLPINVDVCYENYSKEVHHYEYGKRIESQP